MKWIKALETKPEINKHYCLRIKEMRVANNGYGYVEGWLLSDGERIHDYAGNYYSLDRVEWLDESNQEGSLKDWKEKIGEEFVFLKNLYEVEDGRIPVIHRVTKWIEENVIGPLLQNEYKGDDLESSSKSLGIDIGDAVRSGSSNSDEQINYVDAEDWLWSFMQDWEDYKNENQSRWIAHSILFKEFIQKKQAVIEAKIEAEVSANTNDPFIQKHLTRIKKKIKETTEWWEANRDKPLYVQCLPSDKDAFNIPNSNLWLRRTVFVFEDLQVPNSSSQTLTQIEQDKKQTL